MSSGRTRKERHNLAICGKLLKAKFKKSLQFIKRAAKLADVENIQM